MLKLTHLKETTTMVISSEKIRILLLRLDFLQKLSTTLIPDLVVTKLMNRSKTLTKKAQ